jgi:hypothetical protein
LTNNLVRCIKAIVRYFDCADINIETCLLALDALKWLFKGKEYECAVEINPALICKKVPAAILENPRFKASLLELIGIMINFCSRKINEME